MEAMAVPNCVKDHPLARAYLSLPLMRFIVITSVLSFLLPSLIEVIRLHLLNALNAVPVHLQGRPGPMSLPTFADSMKYLFISVLAAPIVETVLFHSSLLLLLLRMTKSDIAAILICAEIFGIAHFRTSTMAIVMTAVSGIFIGFSFVFWYRKSNSTKQGFSAACGVHVLHNFYYYLLTFVPASVLF